QRPVHRAGSWRQNLGDQSARRRRGLPCLAAGRKLQGHGGSDVLDSAKIMIVDDEPQARRVLRAALVTRAFEVSDARSGEEALESLRDEDPDVILLDLKMPGIGGLETCRLIRD